MNISIFVSLSRHAISVFSIGFAFFPLSSFSCAQIQHVELSFLISPSPKICGLQFSPSCYHHVPHIKAVLRHRIVNILKHIIRYIAPVYLKSLWKTLTNKVRQGLRLGPRANKPSMQKRKVTRNPSPNAPVVKVSHSREKSLVWQPWDDHFKQNCTTGWACLKLTKPTKRYPAY